jgi:hypothetical protein
MMRRAVLAWLLCGAMSPALAAPKADEAPQSYRFAVIGHGFLKDDGKGEKRLKDALERSADPSFEFVVATGIKAEDEPCLDALYTKRRDLYDSARRPLIVVPAASDWTGCVDDGGVQVAAQRMSRIRELFYGEPLSLGRRPMEVARLSQTARYRRFAENAYWEVGKVLYATINLPSNNNNYSADAGRNNEFEDRWVANRFWLKRVFTHAQRSRAEAVVLFSEADIKMLAQRRGLLARLRKPPTLAQDGFLQTRRLLSTLSQKFPGKVLLVDTAMPPKGAAPALVWRERIGHLSVGSAVVEIEVAPGSGKTLFTVEPLKPAKKK